MDRWQIMQIIDCHLRERGQDPDLWTVALSGRFNGSFTLQMLVWRYDVKALVGDVATVDIDVTPSGVRKIVDEAVCAFTPALNTEARAS